MILFFLHLFLLLKGGGAAYPKLSGATPPPVNHYLYLVAPIATVADSEDKRIGEDLNLLSVALSGYPATNATINPPFLQRYNQSVQPKRTEQNFIVFCTNLQGISAEDTFRY